LAIRYLLVLIEYWATAFTRRPRQFLRAIKDPRVLGRLIVRTAGAQNLSAIRIFRGREQEEASTCTPHRVAVMLLFSIK
jgi:hypothetical protein